MKFFHRIFFAAALALLGTAWAAPIPEPQESAQGFRSFDLPEEQKGSFELSFDAIGGHEDRERGAPHPDA